MAYKIAQGDQRFVPFVLTLNGAAVSPEMLQELEVCAEDQVFRKLMTKGEVSFNENRQVWEFLLTQQETFGLDSGEYSVQVRPKFRDGTTIQWAIGTVCVSDSHSEAVI